MGVVGRAALTFIAKLVIAPMSRNNKNNSRYQKPGLVLMKKLLAE